MILFQRKNMLVYRNILPPNQTRSRTQNWQRHPQRRKETD